MSHTSLVPPALVAASLLACAPGEGTLDVVIYGESYIEASIPADVFVDGWTLTFDRFLVSVGELTLAQAGEPEGAEEPRYQIFDLAQPSGGAGFSVTSAQVPAGAYDGLRYHIAPAADAIAGDATEEDVQRMRDGGLSIYVEGQAERAGVVKRFAWGFATRTDYAHCKSTAVVADGGVATAQLTVHGDHLFYDDLFSPTPNVTFDLFAAADADADGEITRAELEATDIRPLSNYQVGDLIEIHDLWSFLEQQTTTIGHIDGEGHCENLRED